MTFTSPSGREYVWEKETDPTQEDVDNMMAYDASLPPEVKAEEKQSGVIDHIKQTFINMNKSDDQKGRELFNSLDQELVKSGDLTSAQASALKYEPQAGDINTVSDATANVIKQTAPTAVRIGIPLAAGVLSAGAEVGTGGLATPGVLAFMAAATALGEETARAMEGRQGQTFNEMLVTGSMGATMAPARIAPGVANWLAGSTAEATAYSVWDAQQKGITLDPKTLAINAAMSLGGRGLEAVSMANQARKTQQAFESSITMRQLESTAAEAKRVDDLASSGLRSIPDIEGVVSPVDQFIYGEGVRRQQAPIIAAREANAAKQAVLVEQANANNAALQAERKFAAANAELQVAGTDPFTRNPEFIKTRDNTNLSDLIGTNVTYSGYNGRLIRDPNGEFGLLKEVTQKGEPTFIEIADSGKNPSLLAHEVGVTPQTGWETPYQIKQSPEVVNAIVEKNNLANDFNVQANELGVHEQITNELPVVTTPKKPADRRLKDSFRSEYGKIDPLVMHMMGRAGLGFAAGVVVGDTPQEDIGYGLGLAVMGATLSPTLAKKLGGSVMEKFGSTTAIKKLVPETLMGPLMVLVHQTQDDSKALLVRTSFAKAQLEKALNGISNPVAKQRTSDLVFDYMTKGTPLNQLPTAVQNAALNARESISELSDVLISRGLAMGQLVQTLTSNRDTYLRRAYKIFLDDNYKPSKVDTDNWIRANVSKELANPANLKTRQLLTEQFTEDLSDMLDRKVAGNYVLSGTGRGKTNIFTARDTTIDALTRKVYGEINDPIALLGDTAPRMANAAASFKTNTEMAALGERLGMFQRTAPDAATWKRLTVESDLDSPFSGLFAKAELRDAMDSVRATSSAGAFVQSWNVANSLMKAAKTLGSVKAYTGNAWGAFTDVVANGHSLELIRPSNWKTGLTNAGMTFGVYEKNGRLSTNKALKVYEDFVREGLIDKSVSGHDFSNSFRHSFFQKNFGTTIVDKPLDIFRSGMSTLGKVYSSPETFGKVFNMAGEVRALKAAATGMSDEMIFKEAAAKVRATTATPREQWKIVRQLSTAGAIDPFIAYTIDRYRVVYNTYKIAGNEMKSSNAGIRAMGYKRALTMTTLLGGGAVLGSNFAMSKDQEKAIRNRVPDYAKNGTLHLTAPDKDGNFTFTNLNYIVPQTIVTEAAMAGMRGDSPQDAVKNFFGALTSQAFGENLTFNILRQVAQNETTRGVQIRSDNDPLLTRAMDVGSFVLNEGFVPIAFGELARVKQSWDKPITSPSGRVITKDDLFLANFAGIRIMRMNLNARVQSEAKGISSQLGKDDVEYKSNYKNAVSDSERDKLFQNKLSRDAQTFANTQSLFADAKTLGFTNEKLAGLARDSGMPSRISLGAIDNIYTPPKQEKDKSPTDIVNEMVGTGASQSEVLAEIKAIAGKDKFQAINLMNSYRSMVIEQKKGITDQDKLLSSLSEGSGDRANYIARKLDLITKSTGDAMSHAYYLELRKKGIVTPAVNSQLKSLGVNVGN